MDDGGVRAGCIRIRCPSPRRIVSRWFSPQGKIKGRKTAMAEARVRDDCDVVRIRTFSEDSHHGVGQLSDSPPPTIHSEKFLEFHNDELRRKQQEFRFPKQEQTETSAYSATSDVVDGPESSTDHYYSPQIIETSMSVGGEGSLSHYVYKRGDDSGGEMDQLEAELEAEFELLQIGQDHDGISSKLKEVSEKSENAEGLRLVHVCPGLVEEQQGVCPYELERRLHELMETRQQEEIKELEIALDDAKQRLHLKETEASWWKDTAYIVSERIPEPSRITYSSRTHPYPLSR
ncbi:unnamed protein product [Arabidopsis arenosa]|uniref:Uncharacterized protein n=1 Tax=Arabidopsis arenosa TaxID=38785 RepID=A0A8S2AJY3_ARAAE|nr:unnamed protein product [Arabidopsis arenosa]